MYEEATQVANDAVSSIRTVASFCAEPKVIKTYYGKCKAPVRQGIRQGIVSGLVSVYRSSSCTLHMTFVSTSEQSLWLMAKPHSLKYSE